MSLLILTVAQLCSFTGNKGKKKKTIEKDSICERNGFHIMAVELELQDVSCLWGPSKALGVGWGALEAFVFTMCSLKKSP